LRRTRRERDQAREEAKKQSGMTDTLTSRVEALVAELEAERKENTLLRQTASIKDRALESWKEKCKGMLFPDLSACWCVSPDGGLCCFACVSSDRGREG
jgi:hypothetical protein